MKEAITMSIHSKHNKSRVSMYHSDKYNIYKYSSTKKDDAVEVDARLYRDLSVEFGLIRVMLSMIRNTKSLIFTTIDGVSQSKKITGNASIEGYYSGIEMCIVQEEYYVNCVYYYDSVLRVDVSIDNSGQFKTRTDTSYEFLLKYMRGLLQAVVEIVVHEYLQLGIRYSTIQSQLYPEVMSVLRLQCSIIKETVPYDMLGKSGFDTSGSNTCSHTGVEGIVSIGVVTQSLKLVNMVQRSRYDTKFDSISNSLEAITVETQVFYKVLCTAKKLLESIHSFMSREGRYVRGVYGVWGNGVGTPCCILHEQLLENNDMLVFINTGGMYYDYLDVVDTDTTIRVPVELFQKRVMLNTAINLQSIKDTIHGYLETVLDAMYNK